MIFWFFWFLIFWLIMSCFIEGQWKTDKDNRMPGHMTIIPFLVLCKCRNALKRAKTTKIKSHNNNSISSKMHLAGAYSTVSCLLMLRFCWMNIKISTHMEWYYPKSKYFSRYLISTMFFHGNMVKDIHNEYDKAVISK